LQLKLFVIHLLLLLLVGVLMIVGLTIFSQVIISSSTTTATAAAAAAAATEMTDMELEDKAIKQEIEQSKTEQIDDDEEEDTAKQQEEQPSPLGITMIQGLPLPPSPVLADVTSTIPPTALAGADQVVKEGDKVTLDGTGSFDPDGTIVSYEWTLEEWDDEDPPATLSGANTTTATFTAPVLNSTSGAYGFDLIVTDNDGLTHTDSTVVTVKKAASEESNLQ
jgi:hypothetical protein